MYPSMTRKIYNSCIFKFLSPEKSTKYPGLYLRLETCRWKFLHDNPEKRNSIIKVLQCVSYIECRSENKFIQIIWLLLITDYAIRKIKISKKIPGKVKNGTINK
jgi:hypothetical protein